MKPRITWFNILVGVYRLIEGERRSLRSIDRSAQDSHTDSDGLFWRLSILEQRGRRRGIMARCLAECSSDETTATQTA